MRYKTLRKAFGRFFGVGRKGTRKEVPSTPCVTIDPLTVGLRVQTRSRTGAGMELKISRMIWVSPMGSDPENLRSLRVQVIPN